MNQSDLIGILVAAIGGAAIGVERQQSGHASGQYARLGGVRTFTLFGGLAGLAGWLTARGYVGLGLVLAAGLVALIIAGYVAASRREVDATTEAAALVVVGAGLAAGLGWIVLASGAIAVTALLLVQKSQLHAVVKRIDDEELRAAARFAVMAVVILPLLPEGPLPSLGGIKPRELWMLVLLFSGLTFFGYLARRLLGADRGYPVAGLFGGLISSTNVTYTFARLSQRERGLSQPLAIGTLAACTMLFPRVLVATTVLNVAVARALLPYLVAPFTIGAVIVLFWWRRRESADLAAAAPPSNPLQVRPALEMAGLFQIVLWTVGAVGRRLGDSGLLAAGALLGLTDVDALTISMSTIATADGHVAVAAQAIAIGILANSLLKMTLAVVLGAPPFRWLTGVFVGAMTVAIAISIAVLR